MSENGGERDAKKEVKRWMKGGAKSTFCPPYISTHPPPLLTPEAVLPLRCCPEHFSGEGSSAALSGQCSTSDGTLQLLSGGGRKCEEGEGFFTPTASPPSPASAALEIVSPSSCTEEDGSVEKMKGCSHQSSGGGGEGGSVWGKARDPDRLRRSPIDHCHAQHPISPLGAPFNVTF